MLIASTTAGGDTPDRFWANGKVSREMSKFLAIGIAMTNHFDVSGRQLSAGDTSDISRGKYATAFLSHVSEVVGSRAQKQMGRVHAEPHITVMTDAEIVRNWTVGEYPRQAMGKQWPAVQLKLSVAAISRSRPQPAGVGLPDLAPEAMDREWLHNTD